MQAMRTVQSQQVGPGTAPIFDISELEALARIASAASAASDRVLEQPVVERDVEVVSEQKKPFAMPALQAVKDEMRVRQGFDEAKTRFDQAKTKTREDYEDAEACLHAVLKQNMSDSLRDKACTLFDNMIADSARVEFHPWLRRKKASLFLISNSANADDAISNLLAQARSADDTRESLKLLGKAYPNASKAVQANIVEALRLSFIDAKPEKQMLVDGFLDRLLLMKVYPETSFVYSFQRARVKIRANQQGVGKDIEAAFKATLKEKDWAKMDAMQGALFAALERKLTSSFVTPERRVVLEKVIHDLKNPSPYLLNNLQPMSSEDAAKFKEAIRYYGPSYHVWGEKRLPVDLRAAKEILRALSDKGVLEADAQLAFLYRFDSQYTMRYLYKCYDHMRSDKQAIILENLKAACGEENAALYDCYEEVLKNALTAKDIESADLLQQYINVMGPVLGGDTLDRQLVEMSQTKSGRALLRQCDHNECYTNPSK